MIHTRTEPLLRSPYVFVALMLVVSLITATCFDVPLLRVQLVGTARKPLVLVGGQPEQLPTADYLSSPGGMSVNATAATGAGDFEATTFNGVALTGAGGGSVSVSSTTTVTSAGHYTVNATTEGTIDWVSPGNVTWLNCQVSLPTKVKGGQQLKCLHGGIYPWFGGVNSPGDIAGSCGAGCTVAFTWSASDTTASSIVSVAGSAYYDGLDIVGPSTGSTAGWVYNAPALTTQFVLRQYLGVINMTSVSCTGTLSDGSGTATTAPFNTGTGVLMYYAPVWTYHAATPGSYLTVVCSATIVAPTGGHSYSYWLGETLNTI